MLMVMTVETEMKSVLTSVDVVMLERRGWLDLVALTTTSLVSTSSWVELLQQFLATRTVTLVVTARLGFDVLFFSVLELVW